MVISATTTVGAMERSEMSASELSASGQKANPVRLLLVDDKVILREGMRAYLEQQSGFEVVGQAGSLAEAVALDIGPDVVVTDLVASRSARERSRRRAAEPLPGGGDLRADRSPSTSSRSTASVRSGSVDSSPRRQRPRNFCRGCAVSPTVCRMCSRRCGCGGTRPRPRRGPKPRATPGNGRPSVP